jgi:hypothetical protein
LDCISTSPQFVGLGGGVSFVGLGCMVGVVVLMSPVFVGVGAVVSFLECMVVGGGWTGFDSIDPMLVVHGWGLICIMGWVALYGNGRSRLLFGRSEWRFWRLVCAAVQLMEMPPLFIMMN